MAAVGALPRDALLHTSFIPRATQCEPTSVIPHAAQWRPSADPPARRAVGIHLLLPAQRNVSLHLLYHMPRNAGRRPTLPARRAVVYTFIRRATQCGLHLLYTSDAMRPSAALPARRNVGLQLLYHGRRNAFALRCRA